MAKPGKRSNNSQKRPTYNKILKQQETTEEGGEGIVDQIAVSYTHLTLPTIYSV